MNEDVHHIDNLLRSTLEHYEEIPSPAVKESLNAILDKKDAEAYKRKYEAWKRIAILVLIMLSGYILYESGTENINADHSKESSISKNTGIPGKPQMQDTITNISTAAIDNKLMNKHNIISTSTNRPPIKKNYWSTNKKVPPKLSILTLRNKSGIDKLSHPLINSSYKMQQPTFNYTLLKNKVINIEQLNKGRHFKPYWMITGWASYEQMNYRLDSDLPNAITSIRHREVHEPSFSGGIFSTLQIKKQWALQTGLVLSHTSIGISPQKIYAFQEPAGSVAFKYITSSGYAYIKPGTGAPPAVGDSLNTAEAKHILESFSVPLVVKYVLERNKFSFRPGIGIEANLMTSANVEVEIEETPSKEVVFINKLNGAKPFYWSLTADVELQYRVNNKMFLTFRPSFKHALSPITEDNVVETFPYSFGLGMGMTYKFR
ncbi:hypothetical protein OCK74_27120 [Chitinophagaceae bacterium LB-8]|uniref:Outer membrane protein beta-barrel domain-containing protein n=1 Tax=Paraflavisolibacter caeni TaxID=2982496 RepID=A0A9X2Y155_9BACT|nr:hypothetical protein [Paraflavisolibacter caeni]MCU7552820.1 hypothetical protein [Paraflavisolibacter caeni]